MNPAGTCVSLDYQPGCQRHLTTENLPQALARQEEKGDAAPCGRGDGQPPGGAVMATSTPSPNAPAPVLQGVDQYRSTQGW